MNKLCIIALSSMGFCTLLGGCSTPAPLRELATRGAGTVGQAETSLRNYLDATGAQLAARADLVRSDAEQRADEAMSRELAHAYELEAGSARDDSAADLIHKMAAKSQQAREKKVQVMAKIGAENKLDPETLPKVPSEKLAEAKKSFIALSEELSADEWISLLGQYANTIAENLEKLESSADDAKEK